ncbi:hypothetical protein GYMLUDRAFT_248299 [Collybiopsis luxurians FD-317 M1]|uniref:Uncharacterized protein n=1 Tax=Collybiopsis luxurians FD-317 M1 TaxID=944289 RepID=A0A0D0AYU4_9AGAR|nr:hypothetical protein GYMLUDRAFT_248299 [Collybiopsis luxurians FD-317 M1]
MPKDVSILTEFLVNSNANAFNSKQNNTTPDIRQAIQKCLSLALIIYSECTIAFTSPTLPVTFLPAEDVLSQYNGSESDLLMWYTQRLILDVIAEEDIEEIGKGLMFWNDE